MFSKKFVFVLVLVFLSSFVYAQFPSLPSNLSALKSADVSDEQLSQVTGYMQRNNVNFQQAYDLLVARGMNPGEAAALRARLENDQGNAPAKENTRKLPGNAETNMDNMPDLRTGERRVSDTTNKVVPVLNPKKIFGLEIFSNGVLSFEPNIRIATPVGYVIGPDDEININIYGYQEAKYSLKVGAEGEINIPYVGVMNVAGLTIEQATTRIKNRLSASGYSNIKTGLTKVSVTLGKIRSIKVTVLGEVKNPGTYTLPSLATAFNALYLSGGPNEIGSMRNIEIIRSGKIVDHLDIYDFLVHADQSGNINLHDQDVIRIPPYQVRVSLEGQVKRSGLFEIKKDETLQDLLDFGGGFADSAYTGSVTAYTLTDIDRKITDVPKAQFASYHPTRSESFVVKRVTGRYLNRVTITGAVYMPGDYELTQGMTVKDLIVKAQGLRQNAYGARGIIIRNQEDMTPEVVSFSPVNVMQSGNENLLLQPDDKVNISTVGELKENTTVRIVGEVRIPGIYPYIENMSLKDLVLQAGGFTDAAFPQRIEVARRIKKDNYSIEDTMVSQVFDITSVNDLKIAGADIKLQAHDAVVIRKNPGYQPQINVRLEGEVVFPGPYVLKNKNERISDVIKRAGGLTLQAYNEGGYLTRINSKSVLNQLNTEKINKIQATLKDTSNQVQEEVERTVDQIAIDLTNILANPGSRNDLILEEGDVITVPKEKMDVRISGQVLFPTRVVYDENLGLKDYLGRAGGTTDNARKGKIYVLYPNGNAAKTSNFLFFRSYPKITPGSEVIVPKKHEVERRRLTTGEVVGITTAITSFAGVLISLLINLK